jgi:hypothetical protein
MNFPSSDYRDARQACRDHEEDCDECRELGKNGDMCPEGERLLARAQREYDYLREGPEYDKYLRDDQ